MEKMKRFAVYYAPRPGPFADATAAWLGWDATSGRACPQPDLPGLPLPLPLADLTAEPRKYGFHGTIRAPFRPGEGITGKIIADRVAALAGSLAPVRCNGLQVVSLHGFLALVPRGDEAALMSLGARVVEGTNDLRAPLTEAEIARRQPERLTPRQRELLAEWGYAGVMEEFRFHLTLTGRLPEDQAQALCPVLAAHFAPVLPQPFEIQDLCLFGEDEAARFHLLHRFALTG